MLENHKGAYLWIGNLSSEKEALITCVAASMTNVVVKRCSVLLISSRKHLSDMEVYIARTILHFLLPLPYSVPLAHPLVKRPFPPSYQTDTEQSFPSVHRRQKSHSHASECDIASPNTYSDACDSDVASPTTNSLHRLLRMHLATLKTTNTNLNPLRTSPSSSIYLPSTHANHFIPKKKYLHNT